MIVLTSEMPAQVIPSHQLDAIRRALESASPEKPDVQIVLSPTPQLRTGRTDVELIVREEEFGGRCKVSFLPPVAADLVNSDIGPAILRKVLEEFFSASGERNEHS
jgi:hypothetical protein